MKKLFLITLSIILALPVSIFAVAPTKYSEQQVLNLSFRDSDGNALAFSTKLSAQNVLNLVFDETANALSCVIVGDTVLGEQLIVIGSVTFLNPLFSVAGDTLVVKNGNIGISNNDPAGLLTVGDNLFIVKSDGKIGIGIDPSKNFEIYDDSYLTIMGKVIANTAAMRAMFIGAKAKAGPSAVTDGNYLVSLIGQGYDSSGYDSSPQIDFFANEDWTDSAHGSYIAFDTVDNGTTAIDERMRIDHNGNIGIGVINPSEKLEIRNGSIKISTTTGNEGIIFQDYTEQITAYSPVFSSSAPAHNPSIASVTYVGIASTTVTLDGGRPVRFDVCLTLNNDLGAARTYTIALVEDGVILHEHEHKTAGNAAHSFSTFNYDSSSDKGSNIYSVWVKSTNATGAQTADNVHILVTEY